MYLVTRKCDHCGNSNAQRKHVCVRVVGKLALDTPAVNIMIPFNERHLNM